MRKILLGALVACSLASCDTKAKEQLSTLQHSDSLRRDSLMAVKNELLNDMLMSTQFVNDINAEIAKARSLASSKPKLQRASETADLKAERDSVMSRIHELVARLDSTESRLATTRSRAASLAKKDDALLAQIAAYEKTIGEFRATAERQRVEMQGIIDEQGVQIAGLKGKVDTVTKANVTLAGQKAALTDTVSDLTRQLNTVYWTSGTRDELVQRGVLVEEGRKPFLILGERHTAPARQMDPSKFTQVDRLRDRQIAIPDGEYTIASRHDGAFATPYGTKNGHITGGLRIDQPEQFWASGKYLILLKK